MDRVRIRDCKRCPHWKHNMGVGCNTCINEVEGVVIRYNLTRTKAVVRTADGEQLTCAVKNLHRIP